MPFSIWQNSNVQALKSMIEINDYSPRKCRLFAVALCRHHIDWITYEPCQVLVNLSEQFADGAIKALALQKARRIVLRGPPANWDQNRGQGNWYPQWAPYYSAVPKIVPPYDGFFENTEFVPYANDVFGNPLDPVSFPLAWRTDAAVGMAAAMYEAREFAIMPILADALEEAGCDHAVTLEHCRGPGPHVRGCWVVDRVLGMD